MMKIYFLSILTLLTPALLASSQNGEDAMPEFPGGQDSLMNIFHSELVQPALEENPALKGIIHVEFVVNKKGEVVNARVIQGLDKDLDNQAIEILLDLPNWKPGYKKGKLADYYYRMPIYVGMD